MAPPTYGQKSMPGMQLTCPSCGTLFRPDITARSATFIGCAARCPNCDDLARIPDGTYDLSGIVQKIVEATPSVDEWSALYTALRTIDPDETPPDEVIAAVERAVPRLVFDEILPPGLVLALLQVLLFVIPKIIEHLEGWGPGTAASAVAEFVKPYLKKYIEDAERLAAGGKRPAKSRDDVRRDRNKRKAERQRRRVS